VADERRYSFREICAPSAGLFHVEHQSSLTIPLTPKLTHPRVVLVAGTQ
jgi:hypothetical protein